MHTEHTATCRQRHNATMEGPAAADSADDEYMIMDADTWPEHNNDVLTMRPLENTPNPNTARPPFHSLRDRYMTIRRPPVNANRGPGMKQPPQIGKVHT